MEVIILCVTITSIMAIMLVGIGVLLGRMDKDDCQRQCGTDNHSNDLSDDRGRNRSGNDGCFESMDEKAMMVLINHKVGACKFEKEVFDYLIDKLENSLGYNPYQE